jgi:hypothetical protein
VRRDRRDGPGAAAQARAPSRDETIGYILDMLVDLAGLAFTIGEHRLGADIAEVVERPMLADRDAGQVANDGHRPVGPEA